MNKINKEIANIMKDIQKAAQGYKLPSDPQHEYVEDINNRISDIERYIIELKHYLTKHDLNDWE